MNRNPESEKLVAAKEAVKLLQDGQVVGLGSGSTSFYAIREIGTLVKNGLNIRGIPTSERSRELALSLNIPLIEIHSISSIDITIDGADEFTESLDLIKGGGGALLREKIVASLSKQEVIIADSSKKVSRLGQFKVPVEVIPFASGYVMDQLKRLGGSGKVRQKEGMIFVTDEGNHIIDADFGLIDDPGTLSENLHQIVGVVEHGLFIRLATLVIMGDGDRTVTFTPG